MLRVMRVVITTLYSVTSYQHIYILISTNYTSLVIKKHIHKYEILPEYARRPGAAAGSLAALHPTT